VSNEHQRRIVLNANQRRHFEVIFAGLDASLERILDLVDGRASGALLRPVTGDLPNGFADAARDAAVRVRAMIAGVASDAELAARPVSRQQTCRATLTSEIVRLDESGAAQLRGYGAVDPSMAEHLDPVVRSIRDELASLRALLDPAARAPTPQR
jgi:hypothetical protein